VFELYKDLFSEPDEQITPYVYQEQISEINKTHFWYINALNISQNNPIMYQRVYKLQLQEVLDYMIISTISNKLEQYKRSDSTLPV